MTELTAPNSRSRIQSIDILRGIVMVIMALDHVRDFFYKADVAAGGASSVAMDPTNLATTTPALFFTRWITHFCAPIFVFLAGTSVFLMGQKKSRAQLSSFLIKRGIWLVIVEVIVITFGWTYNPFFNFIILQVIWAIGISMILTGLVILLPYAVIMGLGLVIVFGHNLLDYPSVSKYLNDGSTFSKLLYFSTFSIFNINQDHLVLIVYSFLPWTGVMLLGYCFGKLYGRNVDPAFRRRILLVMGSTLILLFVILRLAKAYGDPYPMADQPRGPVFTFLSFLNVNKYPPSLAFLSMTLGPAMIVLALLENLQNRLTSFFCVYGRVPMFYYILHFYIIHTVAIIVFFVQGFGTSEIVTERNPFLFKPPGFGFGLLGVYAVWLFVFLVLYPLCKKYDRYKSTHKQWWLSYL
jgi:uncharacterized membrane protein